MEIDGTITQGASNYVDDDVDNEDIPQSAGILPEIIVQAKTEEFSLETAAQIMERIQPPNPTPNEEAAEASIENELNFYSPSQFTLTKCCQKLNVTYNQKSYQLWGTFNIKVIKNYSDSIETLNSGHNPSQPMSGFHCLSYLFTGTPDSFHSINLSVNRKLCESLLEGGKLGVFFVSNVNYY